MSWIMVDIEANGPIPGDFSMIEIGAVIVKPGLKETFYGTLKPLNQDFNTQALKAIGRTYIETLSFDDPKKTMLKFDTWLSKKSKGRPKFIADNNGFDWMFVCWYFHHFLKQNPFGFSSTNLGSLFKGMERSMFKNFKHLRQTKHTHNPVDDAKGNAEALLYMKDVMGLMINLD